MAQSTNLIWLLLGIAFGIIYTLLLVRNSLSRKVVQFEMPPLPSDLFPQDFQKRKYAIRALMQLYQAEPPPSRVPQTFDHITEMIPSVLGKLVGSPRQTALELTTYFEDNGYVKVLQHSVGHKKKINLTEKGIRAAKWLEDHSDHVTDLLSFLETNYEQDPLVRLLKELPFRSKKTPRESSE